jgi:hypothetical protein
MAARLRDSTRVSGGSNGNAIQSSLMTSLFRTHTHKPSHKLVKKSSIK